eukprot:Hpha_TRINITY_DN15443_c2_g2::TRINITY_DN15443_c2_g2_i1::g.173969::m.173969/K08287/E2.7.12.1; dual-specificity kinase
MGEEKPTDAKGVGSAPQPPAVGSVVGEAVKRTAAGEQPGAKRQKKTYTPQQSAETGHYHVVLGEDLEGAPDKARWKILDLVGEGTFAKVIEAWDRKRKVFVAVKIVRAVERYVRDAKFEINILHKIKEDDQKDYYSLIKYRSYFFATSSVGQHMCIVFPKLGFCLLEYLNRCGAFKLHEIAHIAWQLGSALNYMHAHLKLIHTDLKPENILLEHPVEVVDKLGNRTYNLPPKTNIRIIDFGGTTDEAHSKSSVVSTRHYRAPEVVVGAGWMWAADIWSIGCILVELFTQKLLYDTHENREHLAMMDRTLGPMPPVLGEFANQESKDKYFDRSSNLNLTWLDSADSAKSAAKVRRLQPLTRSIENDQFRDLLTRCLEYDKTKRIRAHDIMYHPFVTSHYKDAEKSNEAREKYEVQVFLNKLGAEGTPTRVTDPPYEKRDPKKDRRRERDPRPSGGPPPTQPSAAGQPPATS